MLTKSKGGHLFLMIGLLAIGAGFFTLIKYETTPGRAAAAEMTWPKTSLLPAILNKPTLLIAVHPECPCSIASVGELAGLVAKFPDRLSCYILFVPAGAITAEECRKSGLWHDAAGIPGAKVMVDDKNLAIDGFHAQTSGQVFLYDTSGRLCFSGGITDSRGHAGPNDGTDAIAAFLTTGQASPSHTPVFGCSLQ